MAFSEATFGEGLESMPIWLDDVMCTGDEAMLTNCEHLSFGVHNCIHSEDAGVDCLSELATPQPQTTTSTLTEETATPQVTTSQVATPQVTTQQVTTSQVATPQVTTSQVATPQVTTPVLEPTLPTLGMLVSVY